MHVSVCCEYVYPSRVLFVDKEVFMSSLNLFCVSFSVTCMYIHVLAVHVHVVVTDIHVHVHICTYTGPVTMYMYKLNMPS